MRKLSLPFILILFVSLSMLTAQTRRTHSEPNNNHKLPPEHFAPNREFDLVNIKFNLSFNLDKKELDGIASEKINPLRDELKEIHLNAVDMKINSVMIGGRDLKYNYDGKILTIDFDKAYNLKDTLTFIVNYSTTPQKGLYFIMPDSAYPDRTPQIWSQSEMEDARYWYPCHDYPDDYSTSELVATVPDNWVVVSNGLLDKVSSNKITKTKTFDWVESKPHVIYLNSIVAGVYSIIKDNYGSIPIYYYVSPVYKDVAKENFSKTPDILKFYSTVTGYQYPWDKLSLAAVTDFTFGGMENVSAITLTDNTLHKEADEPQASSTGLVAHETAHQWFGDLMTCRSWDQAWLNEGFATYFTALYEEHLYGADEYAYQMMNNHNAVIAADKRERRPTVYNRYNDPVDVFGTYIYPRGASVLHMLRGIIGKDLFFKAIKYYVNKYKFHNVDSHDLQNAVQEATGYNLYWFFDEWLYKGGHPVFDVSYKYNDADHTLSLTVKQVQKVDEITPVYRMPVNIMIQTKSGKMNEKIIVDSLENNYTFNVAENPLMVNFDEGSYLLKEMQFNKSVEELAFQLKNDPDAAGRIWAAQQLSNNEKEPAEKALIDGLENDPFYGVRSECASALNNYSNEESHAALMNALNDKDLRVRDAAIISLGNFNDSKTLETLTDIFKNSPNDYIRAACLNSISKIDSINALPLLTEALGQNSRGQIVAVTALRDLAKVSPEDAYNKAIELTRYGNPQNLRVTAVYLLTRINKDNLRTIDLLKKYASDPYIWMRQGSLMGLGQVGDKSLIPFIKERENIETDGRLKQMAQEAIEQIEKQDK
jgi:aminopeptidase N